VSWLDELDSELRAARVPVGRRHRILAELTDHLATDPGAERRLGSPSALARQFADELGTAYARRAGYGIFLALAPVGVLFGVLFTVAALYTTSVDPPVTIGLALGAQTRDARVLAAADARVLVRRAVLGISGGAIAVATLGFAVFQGRGVQWQVPALAYATVAVGALALTAAAALTARAVVLQPAREGAAGDLASDLGVSVDPWRLAFAIAGAVALCIAVGGVVQADPIDGLVRAIGDGLLCLAGFALLGRPLGLLR
jgi:hypothetical protein